MAWIINVGRGTRVFVATAAVLIVGASLATAAIPSSDTGEIVGCYNAKNGVLRVIDYESGVRCNNNETELRWNQKGPKGDQGDPGTPATLTEGSVESVHIKDGDVKTIDVEDGAITSAKLSSALDGEAVTTAVIRDGAVTDSKLFGEIPLTKLAEDVATASDLASYKASLQNAENSDDTHDDDDPVSWFSLRQVPQNVLNRVAADVQCASTCVSNSEIDNLTITGAKIAGGAVTQDKHTANYGQGTTGTESLASDVPVDVGTTVITPAGTGTSQHAVLVTGQAQILCTNCTGEVIVEAQVVANDALVGAIYSDVLSLSRGRAIVSISQTHQASERTTTTYSLRINTSHSGQTVSVQDPTLIAVDLGRL